MLPLLARLSFAAEALPVCGDGEVITLEVAVEGVEYVWTQDETADDDGVEILGTDGPTITLRCPPCPAHDGDRWTAQVQVTDEDGNRTWANAGFVHECPADTSDGCNSGGAWVVLFGLALRRRR